jgi:hypothetical protein
MIEATQVHVQRFAAEVVEWTVAAFMAHAQAAHDEVVAVLDSIELPFPAQTCAIVELAFGRQLLEGLVTLPSTYQWPGGERAVVDDPLYQAARERARRASREEIEVVGLRSPEVVAVNEALHAGTRPEDVAVAVTELSADNEHALRRIGGSVVAVAQMVQGHGAELTLDVRVTPKRVQAHQAMLQLDVSASDGGRAIIESYAGVGSTIIEAHKQALTKLASCSLHVLIAVLAGRERCRDHVEWEPWRDFEICSGGVLRQFAQEPPVDLRALIEAIRDSLPPLSRELHWCSVFVAIQNGELSGHQITLDSAPHAAGLEVARAWSWPQDDAFYTLRHFFMLVPAGRPA